MKPGDYRRQHMAHRSAALLFIAASLLPLPPAASQPPSTPSTPPITVCELLKNWSRYNGKQVTVTGVYRPWEHGLFLEGEGCEGILGNAAFKWMSVIDVVLSHDKYEKRGLDPGKILRSNEALSSAFHRMFRELTENPDKSTHVTYSGLFITHDDLDARPGDGFGALNAAPGEFYIDQVVDVHLK